MSEVDDLISEFEVLEIDVIISSTSSAAFNRLRDNPVFIKVADTLKRNVELQEAFLKHATDMYDKAEPIYENGVQCMHPDAFKLSLYIVLFNEVMPNEQTFIQRVYSEGRRDFAPAQWLATYCYKGDGRLSHRLSDTEMEEFVKNLDEECWMCRRDGNKPDCSWCDGSGYKINYAGKLLLDFLSRHSHNFQAKSNH